MAHEQDRVLTPLANLEGEVATSNSLIMDVSAVKLMLFSVGHLHGESMERCVESNGHIASQLQC